MASQFILELDVFRLLIFHSGYTVRPVTSSWMMGKNKTNPPKKRKTPQTHTIPAPIYIKWPCEDESV